MAVIEVECPYCGSKEVSLYGKTVQGGRDIFAGIKSAAKNLSTGIQE